jgi:hypothetical protein
MDLLSVKARVFTFSSTAESYAVKVRCSGKILSITVINIQTDERH